MGLWIELWGCVPAPVAAWDGLEPALKNVSFTAVPGIPWFCSVPGVISLPGLELDAVASPGASPSLVPCPPLVLAELVFHSSADQPGVTVRSDVTDLLTPVCFFLQAPIQRRKKPASQKKRRFKTHNDHLVGVLKDYSDVVPGKQWAVEFWSKRAFLDGLSAAGARCLLTGGLTVYNNVTCFSHPSNCRGETGQFKSKYELLNLEVKLIS